MTEIETTVAALEMAVAKLSRDDFSVARPMPPQGIPLFQQGALVIQDVRQLSDLCAKWIKAPQTKKRGFATPDECFMAAMLGMSLGLAPPVALNSLYTVHGAVMIPYQTCSALIQGSDRCEFFDADIEGTPGADDYAGVVRSKRRGRENEYPVVRFTLLQAKAAKLFGDHVSGDAAWNKYTEDLLISKAIGRAARRHWADHLAGMHVMTREDLEPPPVAARGEIDVTPPEAQHARRSSHPAFADLRDVSHDPAVVDPEPVAPTFEPLPEDRAEAIAELVRRFDDRAIELRDGILDDDTTALSIALRDSLVGPDADFPAAFDATSLSILASLIPTAEA